MGFEVDGAETTTERFDVTEGVSFEVQRHADGSYVWPKGTVEETQAFVAWWTELVGCDYEQHQV